MFKLFEPKRVFFEPQALEYPLGRELLSIFKSKQIPILHTSSHNRITGIPGTNPRTAYFEAKRTLVVGVRKSQDFQTCRPSAHFQLPLVTSCPGFCEYCYLSTTLGAKPYIRIYVNLEEILERTAEHISARLPEITIFEGSATSDPVPVEPYTGALAKVVEYFGTQEKARFRFVTKFDDLDSVADARHNGRTEVRFSINSETIIKEYEHHTLSLKRRLKAAQRMTAANYPVGFIVAPIILFTGWADEYRRMFKQVREAMEGQAVSFEFVTYRFTPRAKARILSVFPETTLDMNEESRRFKFGQFGYGKYIYPPDTMKELKEFFTEQAQAVSPKAEVLYTV
ncbi:MAG: spore photoproduct lyase [Candidatus Saccharibacteria bacterium]